MKKAVAHMVTLTLAGVLTASLSLTGCATQEDAPAAAPAAGEETAPASSTEATEVVEGTTVIDDFDLTISNRDKDASYDEATATAISFSAPNQVETITEEGTYIVSGTSEGGQLVVDLRLAEDPENAKVQVVLDGLTLTNTTAPALLVTQADKVFITLAEASINTLSDGSGRSDLAALGTSDGTSGGDAEETAEEANENATLYSHDDLTINGSGTLNVSSTLHHAIKSQDDLVITGGTVVATAGGDGIRGKDCIKIAGGTISVKSGDDGIVSTQTDAPYEKGFVSITGGSVTVSAADDGIKGEALVRLAGGNVNVESSTEGLEACLIWLEDGVNTITSSDDGINAAGDIRSDYLLNIIGGTTCVDAEGDGLDSNDTITQSGGTIVVAGATLRFDEGAVDAERVAAATGGTMLAVDSAGMSMGYGTESTQGSLLYTLDSVQGAGTRVSLVDSSGAVVFSFVAPKELSNLAYSSPLLVVGESYRFVIGGTLSGGSSTAEQEAVSSATSTSPAVLGFDFKMGGSLDGGETLTSFTLSEQIAQVSADGSVSAYSGQGMMGGMGPGGGGGGGDRPRW